MFDRIRKILTDSPNSLEMTDKDWNDFTRGTNMNKLSRKQFLYSSAALLTVPTFLEQCASSPYPRLAGKLGIDPLENSDAENFPDPILKAINVGITAPNPHNSQAWKFKILSALEMELYVDETRILPVTDPTTRQIHIGQGTFLELLKIGANQLGYNPEIKILPKGDYAFSQIGKKPVASVQLTKRKEAFHPLYSAVKIRATNRAVYEGDLITEAEIQKIRELGNPTSSQLFSILDFPTIDSVQKILFESMKVESTTFRTNDESRIWFRFSDSEIQSKRDGIALPDQGVTGFTRWMAESFFMGPEVEKFHDPRGIDIFLGRYKKALESSKAIVYWKTNTNTKKDWILSGMDYARFHLAVTNLGLKMHPCSQPLQEFPEMEALRKQLEKTLNVRGSEKVQMIARLGRSTYQYFTPRRSLKNMIVS